MKFFTGHLSFGRITIYGANAMRFALQVRFKNGYLVARPTTFQITPFYIKDAKRFHWWRWYVYFSPDATPNRRVWGVGPGLKGR